LDSSLEQGDTKRRNRLASFHSALRFFFSFQPGPLTFFSLRITVLPMTTLTFKVDEQEARNLRVAARRAKLTLSEYLRRQIRMNTAEARPVSQIKCRHTGAMIFAPAPHHPPLTTESVKEMLADFP